ncbi:MAG TPA: hypothetical protein VFY92_12035 [Hyphomicrobiaceae bacterium]|nr:hypothetical protein [Hyphomicrobiaceae bacterium]
MSKSAASTRPASVAELAASTRQLSELLLISAAALAAAGDAETACRVAGQACVALRGADPAAARRFDALLHRLTPALKW